jgi:hypothetical protein
MKRKRIALLIALAEQLEAGSTSLLICETLLDLVGEHVSSVDADTLLQVAERLSRSHRAHINDSMVL